VNHEQDWAAISDRGDIDIYDITGARANASLNLVIGLFPLDNAIMRGRGDDLGVDSVDMQGLRQVLRLPGTKCKHNFSRSESQPSSACVCNGDRNSERETLEVLEGACVTI
jgi:hypothetical protein